ncbi:MAG TPA: LytTR family DNA-binding domain-containing protein [Puia sp.]|jgi:DNA-binding LytR/AlgR family response regulator
MNCIIVDDEPLAREGIRLLVDKTKELVLLNSFSNANAAGKFMEENVIDLVFLDIRMPGVSGIDFARTIPPKTLVIFTTAYAEFALDSYEVDAADYLIKPIKPERFQKAVAKVLAYSQLLEAAVPGSNIEKGTEDYFFIKADRKFFKVWFKDILFVEGLKDYVILYTEEQKIMTAMNIKTIHDQLPRDIFARVSKSFIINVKKINSFDNNTIFIGQSEIPIGNAYRSYFFDEFVTKKLLSR